MIVQAINNTNGTLTYSAESVTISANSTVTLSNSVLVPFSVDPHVVSDILNGNLSLSDTVTTYSGGSATAFLSNAISILNNFDKNSSGTISALNGTVVADTQGSSAVTFTIMGTWVATLVTEATVDGTNWFAWGFITPAGAIGSSATANGNAVVPCGSFSQVRLRASSYTSGTATVTYNAGVGNNIVQVYNLAAASLLSTAWLNDGSGNKLTSSSIPGTSAKQSLDVNVVSPVTNFYSAAVNIRQSATSASGTTVWTMRNAAASTKTVNIERIYLIMSFDSGTPLTRALLRYDLERFTSATPTGGTAITVVSMDSSNPATQVTDVRFLDTGLTTTGAVPGPAFITIGCPATDQTVISYFRDDIGFKLAAGEGLAIRLNVAAVIGQGLTGEIVWSER